MTTKKALPPLIALSLGIYILASQFIIPVWQYRAQKNFVNPVAGVHTTFWEQNSDLIILEETHTNPPPYFYLSAEKIELKETPVETNSTKAPDHTLIHIKGTALPGDGPYSADRIKIPTVISGHSVSPFFFNAEDPNTYFTKLPKLEKNDLVEIKYRNKNFQYRVVEKRTVSPNKLWQTVKEESAKQQAELVLFTCVPPGLKINRLVVFADYLEHQN